MRRSPFLLTHSAVLLALSFAALSLGGCRIDTHKNGKNDVNVGTPFGSMQVKTDNAAALNGLGLTAYPGATAVHDKGENDGAANVNLSFGNFKLGVHALELQTGDPQNKVLAFYRKDMSRYGTLLTCHGAETVGTPKRTAEGLTCNGPNHDYSDSELQLRAGSPGMQHVVSVKGEDGGTRIVLLALELPGDSKQHGDSDRE